MNQTSPLTPEESLIFLASRINLNSDDTSSMQVILKQSPDWSIIKKYAKQLGIEPLLYKHLSQYGNAHNVPDEMMLSLKHEYLIKCSLNYKIYCEVERILNVTNESGITIVLLKGAFLAKYIYGDIALRPMVDIDILVKEEDSEIVQEKLTELGFEKATAYHASSFHEEFLRDEAKHLIPLYKPKVGAIEIHLDIFPRVKHDSEDMVKVWESMQNSNLDGFQIKSLSPEYLILYLCLHLYYHITTISADHGIRFFWFCDIHEIIRHYKDKINWESFCSIVNSIRVGAQVSTILAYMRNNWNTPIPDTVLPCVEKGINGLCLTTIIRSILDGSKTKRSHIYRYIKKATIPLAKETGRNRFYYLWKEIFPIRSNLIYRYNLNDSSLVYGYYIIHLCKLCIRSFTSIYYCIIHLLRK